MPGRKKMPNKLKLVKGTLQPCRETTTTPKPSRDKGAYIKMRKGVMNKTAQKQWQLMAPELTAAGLLTPLDVYAFEMYCVAYAQWQDALGQLEVTGSVIQGRAGIQVINPYVKIANQAFIQQRQMLLEFQCTPASRAKAGGSEIEDDEDDGDPLA